MAKPQIKQLIGVYNADGGFRGELAYLSGRLRQTVHCELCDITNSPVRRKKEWDLFTSTLPVPFELRHRNELEDQPDQIVHMALKAPPCVIAVTDEGPVVLLSTTDLAKARGDITILDGIMRNKIVARDLELPAAQK